MVMTAACTENGGGEHGSKLPAPSGLAVETVGSDAVWLSWNAGSGDVKGYYVFSKDEGAGYYVEPSASLPADSGSYLFESLSEGWHYFGVQARAENAKYNSETAWSEKVRVIDYSKAPAAKITSLVTSYAYIFVDYSFERVGGTPSDYGLCLSAEHTPTVEDSRFQGPALSGSGTRQLIPNAVMEYGKEYRLRAYVHSGGEYWYSEETKFTLPAEPAAPQLTWNKLSVQDLPPAVEIYETTSALNGRKFHAWYAIADCTGAVEFKVLNPSSKATLENQAKAAGNCLVMINGGIFGTKHIGVIYAGGVKQAWRDEVDGSYWAWDAKLYNLSRAIIGADASGKPSAFWTSAPDADHVYFYDRPMATVMGEPAWPSAADGNPGPAILWNPVNALSTGPMLVYGGKCTVDRQATGKTAGWSSDNKTYSYYYSNYECWAPDIYPTKPDRTAVGYTAEGKIVLFICDGRIADSDGAYIDELALIMKSLGCVAAMNLDGGGSTAMVVNGRRLNSLLTGSGTATENRPVLSTLGFFRK